MEYFMKRTVCFLAVFILAAFVLYADEPKLYADEPKDTGKKSILGLGAGYIYTSNPELHGGHLELSINLYRNIFYIQNRFTLRAGGFSIEEHDSTLLTLSEKLVFGRHEYDTGIYIYLEGGAGFYGNNAQGFSRDTLAYSFGFGGGVELAFDEDFGGLYAEVGYLGQIITQNFPLSGVVVQVGWKFFF
jgi:hypothetical protein